MKAKKSILYRFRYYLGQDGRKRSMSIYAADEDRAFIRFWAVMGEQDAHCVYVVK